MFHQAKRMEAAGEIALERGLHFLLRRAKQAQRRWRLIEEGDRILVGASGGADSIPLIHLLRYWQRYAPENFEIAALHVEPEGERGNSGRRNLLEEHFKALDVELHFVAEDLSAPVGDRGAGFRCFRCSRAKRRALFEFAAERGFNKVALGHHLDDAAETALMNLVFHSNLETMEPKVVFFDGAVTLIRPLILAEKREIGRVARAIGFPYFRCLCPDEDYTQRDHVREFIKSFGRKAKAVKRNIWSASRRWPGALEPLDVK